MTKIVFSPTCLEYKSPRHPESPGRIRSAYEFLKTKNFEFILPKACSEEDILLAHSRALLDKVKSERFFDADTPSIPGIFGYAILAAGAAILAQEICIVGADKAVSLMRPPGHHATKDSLGGFCYFNNLAIAIKKSLARVKRAAILDIDCHHGNGTEDIFKGDKSVLYVSLHQSPLYPGTGLK